MFLTRKRAYARAGLLGNPSDGYHGKTISISVRDYFAEVVLYEWDAVEIVLADDDRAKFETVHDLARDVRLHGYYGGIRLIKATIKRFVEHCVARGLIRPSGTVTSGSRSSAKPNCCSGRSSARTGA